MELGGSLPHSQESTTCPYPSQINPFLCPSHFWQAQLVSFLVRLRAYQYPGKNNVIHGVCEEYAWRNYWPSFLEISYVANDIGQNNALVQFSHDRTHYWYECSSYFIFSHPLADTYTHLCISTHNLRATTETMLQNTGMLLTVCSTSKMVWTAESLNPMAVWILWHGRQSVPGVRGAAKAAAAASYASRVLLTLQNMMKSHTPWLSCDFRPIPWKYLPTASPYHNVWTCTDAHSSQDILITLQLSVRHQNSIADQWLDAGLSDYAIWFPNRAMC